MKKAVIAIVPTVILAEAISRELHAVGFHTNDISVLFPDRRGTKEFAHAQSTKAPEGAAAGAGAGHGSAQAGRRISPSSQRTTLGKASSGASDWRQSVAIEAS